MRCVSYTRTTSCLGGEPIPENVISTQNQLIHSYIKKRGWKLEAKYSDRKRDSDEDTAFQKLRRDGMDRKFDMVVISSAFRCGRSVSYAEDLLLKTFCPAGIHFAVAEDDFCSMDHSVEEVEEYLSRKRRESNVSYMRHAEREKERQGLFDVHDEKYGYLLKDDFTGFDLDEEAVPIIREIFQHLSENMTMQAVADLLNERGVESPAVHLERVGKKNFHANGREWSLGSVQRILQNTAYIGYWTKMVGGEQQTVAIPPIVDKSIFELATKNVASRGRKMPEDVRRSENAFVKQIFDKETGNPLICRRYTEDGDYQMFHKNWFALSKGIRYEAVTEAAVKAILAEKAMAERIAAIITSEEGVRERDRQISLIADDVKSLFEQMAACEEKRLTEYRRFREGEITEPELQTAIENADETMATLDERYDDYMQKVRILKQAFSLKNPWIVHYKNPAVGDTLSKKEVRRWIGRVLVEDFEDIEIEMTKQEWKQYFPCEWLEGSESYGQEEQA